MKTKAASYIGEQLAEAERRSDERYLESLRPGDRRKLEAFDRLLAVLQSVTNEAGWVNLTCGPGSYHEAARKAIAKALGI